MSPLQKVTRLVFLYLLLSSCAPATKITTITPTASATATSTPTAQPTSTPTPIPIPKSLLDHKELLEKIGYRFSEGVITHQDGTGKVWNVIKFNSDGNASIQVLNKNYKGSETSIIAEEIKNLSVVLLNAGHDPMVTIKNKETGKVEKMFLPNKDKSGATEAGWVAPLEISSDPHNPTRINSASEIHTGHIDYSALLGIASQAWPENFPVVRFAVSSGAQHVTTYYDDKLVVMRIVGSSVNRNDKYDSSPQGRNVGYVELNVLGERTVVNLLQAKLSEDGQSIILKIGYGGGILDLPGFYENYLPDFQFLMVYQTIGDQLYFGRGGLQGMSGVRLLYEKDVDNQPWKEELFQKDVEWLDSLKDEDLKKQVKNRHTEISDINTLYSLQGYIFHPIFP